VLDRLVDDDFREYLLRDPVAALASIGVAIDPALVPAVLNLPSKASIVDDHSEVRRNLETTNSMIIFMLSGEDK
jgi:putative modified peptide